MSYWEETKNKKISEVIFSQRAKLNKNCEYLKLIQRNLVNKYYCDKKEIIEKALKFDASNRILKSCCGKFLKERNISQLKYL